MNITFSITDVLIHEVITKIFDHEVSRLKSYLLKMVYMHGYIFSYHLQYGQ